MRTKASPGVAVTREKRGVRRAPCDGSSLLGTARLIEEICHIRDLATFRQQELKCIRTCHRDLWTKTTRWCLVWSHGLQSWTVGFLKGSLVALLSVRAIALNILNGKIFNSAAFALLPGRTGFCSLLQHPSQMRSCSERSRLYRRLSYSKGNGKGVLEPVTKLSDIPLADRWSCLRIADPRNNNAERLTEPICLLSLGKENPKTQSPACAPTRVGRPLANSDFHVRTF